MILKYNQKLKSPARELRKNMTDAERRLWSKIRGKQIKGLQFYRQKIIGNFIVDLYCPKVNLVIEVDGGQHYEKEGIEKDKARDEYLNSLGLRILRFNNFEVLKNIEGVVERIAEEMSRNLS